ncbi:MAG: response regulator [Campylobacterota bacterium]|nr:response regulator [Campylobacterota bacterium]
MSKVLVVEDNEFNSIVLKDMLEIIFPGIEVDVHDSALLSLEIGGHEAYDLILSDIDMPGMSGMEFFTHLREVLNVTMPIIAVTALAVTGDKEKILMHGFEAYISKPIDFDELGKVVAPFLASS